MLFLGLLGQKCLDSLFCFYNNNNKSYIFTHLMVLLNIYLKKKKLNKNMSMQGSCHLSFVEKWWEISYTKGGLLLLINWAHFVVLLMGIYFVTTKCIWRLIRSSF